MVWTVGREGREIKHMDRSVLSRSLATPGIDALFFVPVGGSNRDKRPKSRLEPPTGMKRYFFCPGWWLQPGQKAPDSPPAGLAVGPGTKTPFGPGSNGSRDKRSGTKTFSVVVLHVTSQYTRIVVSSSSLIYDLSIFLTTFLDFYIETCCKLIDRYLFIYLIHLSIRLVYNTSSKIWNWR